MVQNVVDPLLKFAIVPVKIYANITGSLIAIPLWSFKTTWRLIQKPA